MNISRYLRLAPLSAFVLAVALSFWFGCDDTITSDELDDMEIPDTNVSYQEHIQPIFNVKCSSSDCHTQAKRAGGLSLATWSDATEDPFVVNPGEPGTSKLVWSIKGIGGAEPMPPPPYPTLTREQIDGVEQWILEGARDN
jgi:mono/diheme cytochrome c family protein